MDWNVRSAESRPPRTRRKALAWGALVGFLWPLPLLFIVTVKQGGGRDPRKAEGTQLGGALRDFARVEYSKATKFPAVCTGDFDVDADWYTGEYYRAVAVVGHPTPDTGEVFVVPLDDRNSTMRVVFEWNSGKSETEDLDR